MPQVSKTRRNASGSPWVVALWLRFEHENALRARRSAAGASVGRDMALWKSGAERSFPAVIWRASQHSYASPLRRSQLRPASISEARTQPGASGARLFQAARRRESDE